MPAEALAQPAQKRTTSLAHTFRAGATQTREARHTTTRSATPQGLSPILIIALAGMLLLCPACQPQRPVAVSAGIAEGEKTARELEEAARILVEPPDSKAAYDARWREISHRVRSLAPERFLALTEYLCLKEDSERTDFERELLDEVICTLIYRDLEHNTREMLVFVLSRACPVEVNWRAPEWALMIGGERDIKSRDRILVLVQSYQESSDPRVRSVLVQSLKNSFPHIATQGGDDLFVKECATWYRKNRKRLKLNVNYMNEFEDWVSPDRRPRVPGAPGLFVEAR